MDVVLQLCERMGLMKKYVGIAGLKDKIAITRQWISIPHSAVAMAGWLQQTIALLEQLEGVSVLETKRYSRWLRVGDNIWNTFRIKLAAQKDIPSWVKEALLERLERIKHHGFPNYYGMQRFGKWLKNLDKATRVIADSRFWPGQYVSKFVLQSYANYHFNKYVTTRWSQQNYLLEWDILVDKNHHNLTRIAYYLGDNQVMIVDRDRYESEQKNLIKHDISQYATHQEPMNDQRKVTGPLLWVHGLIPPRDTEAFRHENSLYSRLKFWYKKVENCQHFGMLWRRRPLWVFPDQFSYQFDEENNIFLTFSLPTGSYATVLVGTLFEDVDQATMIGNRLIVPH